MNESTGQQREMLAALLLRRKTRSIVYAATNSTSVPEEIESLLRKSRKGVDEMTVDELQTELESFKASYTQIVNAPELTTALDEALPAERAAWDVLLSLTKLPAFDTLWGEAPDEFKDAAFQKLVYAFEFQETETSNQAH